MSTKKNKNFIELSPTSTKLCHVKHDRFIDFYISLEKKREKLEYLCNNTTDLHKI